MAFYDQVSPLYSCYRYNGDFCKIVKFKRRAGDGFPRSDREEKSENEKIGERFLASLSRSRSMVLQYVLSNGWDYFCTFTIDGSKHDRFNLDNFYVRFSQFVRDYRKKYGCALVYVLVPEKHQDGAWHLHGVIRGLPADAVSHFVRGVHPENLVNGGFLNWDDYSSRFGYCSLGLVRDPVKVAFYLAKYITKDMGENIRRVGSHMYYASRGIKKAQHYGDCYFSAPELDNFLSNDYDFCKTGYGHLPWDYACEFFDGIEYESDREDVAPVLVDDHFEEWEQMQLALYGGLV